MGLSQSDKIFGALLVAFIIYITVRGQLSGPNGYLGIFQHSAKAASNSNPLSSILSSITSSLNAGIKNEINPVGASNPFTDPSLGGTPDAGSLGTNTALAIAGG